MPGLPEMGRMLLWLGLGVAVLGGLLWLLGSTGLPFGRLPGDIYVRRGNFSFYFPLVTSIVLSLILTFLFNLLARR